MMFAEHFTLAADCHLALYAIVIYLDVMLNANLLLLLLDKKIIENGFYLIYES
jgi:hypothetical protein